MIVDVDTWGNYDKIIVNGPYAALFGTLTVCNSFNYQPTQLVSLPFLTATSIVGDFQNFWWLDISWGSADPESSDRFGWETKLIGGTYVFRSVILAND